MFDRRHRPEGLGNHRPVAKASGLECGPHAPEFFGHDDLRRAVEAQPLGALRNRPALATQTASESAEVRGGRVLTPHDVQLVRGPAARSDSDAHLLCSI
jgi:hypothetical protein